MLISPGRAVAAGTKGNASAAVGFIEDAQNTDGGFGTQQGASSDPQASLWAAVALLSAGKNPADELLVNGKSLQAYLSAHTSAYTSLSDLGLLTITQAASELSADDLGGPAAKLATALTPAAAKADPQGAALGVLGLVAEGTDAAKAQAATVGQALLGDAYSDGGWGAGQSDSVSTALVLQALAVAGVATSSTAQVTAGVKALQAAQGNDGSIAVSDRTDLALASGDVASTAFTAQALQALGLKPIANANGKTVLDGLTQYQQQSSGGLCDDCAFYSQIKPSVVSTSQAFPAFDGLVLPPSAVAAGTAQPRSAQTSPGPSASPSPSPSPSPSLTKTAPAKSPSTSATPTRVSSGTASRGASGPSSSASTDPGAFKGAKYATPTPTPSTATSSSPKPTPSKTTSAAAAGNSGGTGVSGQVVTAKQVPHLVTAAGATAPIDGLSGQGEAEIGLGAALIAALLLGLVADIRRPRPDPRPPVAVGVQVAATVVHQARVRGAFAPAAALIVGVGLLLVPLTTGMFGKAPHGDTMIAAFRPYMSQQKLAQYQADVDVLNAGVTEAQTKGPALLYPNLAAAKAKEAFTQSQVLLTPLADKWPQVNADFQNVTRTVNANRENFDRVAALPRFASFGWFFVIPGAVLALLGLVGLLATLWRRRPWRLLRWVALAVGIGLLVAPSVFSLWTRAPAGAHMVDAFATVETQQQVTEVQNDFGQLALVDAALATLTGEVQGQHLSAAQVEAALPDVAAFNQRWVTVLHDFTPLLGVMSDQVPNYQAVAALPSFAVFPWLFAVPGALIVLVVAGSFWRGRLQARAPAVDPAPAGPAHDTDAPTEHPLAATT